MNTIKLSVLAVVSAVTASAFADWNFNVGYAWRQQAETSFKGAAAQGQPGGNYADGHVNLGERAEDGYPDWEGGNPYQLPSRTVAGVYDYALFFNGSEATGSGGSDDSASGLTASIGCDLYQQDAFDISAVLRFAGYWGFKNSSAGGFSTYLDTYRFTSIHVGEETPARLNGDEPEYEGREYLSGGPGGRVTLKSDLYQIGLGPKATWHAASWLDIYGGVEALCTFANSELDAGGASTDEVNCLWGVGGHVGFTGWFIENVGIFGQIGYEWIEDDEVSVQGVRAETDYSSLVLSAGVRVRF